MRILTQTTQIPITDLQQWQPVADGAPHWLDIADPQRDVLTTLGLHPLVIEDIMHGGQRTKVDHYDGYLFFVFYAFAIESDPTLRMQTTPLYVCVSANAIITIHHGAVDLIDVSWRRWQVLRHIPTVNQGILLHGVLDTVVDSYFPLIDEIGDAVEELEARVLSGASPAQLRGVLQLKRTLLEFRRHVAPTREALNALLRGDLLNLDSATIMQIQDVYDHVLRIIDGIDLHRDLLAAVLDVHLSVQSNRLNQVMKVLTIASIILMANSLIAGIYGMNFDIMPELRWAWGYPVAIAGMGVISGVLFWFFRRRGWLSADDI
jgi:magnesium transporter